MIVISYYFIQDDPVCDESLVLWTQFIIGLVIISGAVQLMSPQMDSTVLFAAQVAVGRIGLWIWGQWLVYGSEVCDEGLWYFAFGRKCWRM